MKLIDNWRQWWRFSSVWFQVAAAAFFSFIASVPDAVIYFWAVLPADIRASFEPQWLQWAGVALIVIGVIARVVKQPSLGSESNASVSGETNQDMRGTRD